MGFGVSAIPNFIAFLNGNQFKNFKGANQQMLFSTIAELSDKLPQGKLVSASAHDKMMFKQFKPTHLKPQAFNQMTNLDKMRQFIEKFVESDTVKNECGSVENFKKWLSGF